MNKLFYRISNVFGVIPLSVFTSVTKQKIIFPFYHLVSDKDVIHIKHLYKIRSERSFIHDLEFFLKHYKAIGYQEYKQCLSKGSLSQNCFLLSFDDGLTEFHDIIAPILIKKGIPAVCFLNSGFIDNGDLFFRYKASILIEILRKGKISNHTGNAIKKWFQQKNLLYDTYFNSLLSITYAGRTYLDELADLIGYSFEEYLHTNKPYMTKIQINDLIKQGFEFGAHSIDHPQYADITVNEQLIQTKKSIETITAEFNLDYRLFSFPFTDDKVSRKFFNKVFDKNYAIAEMTFGCAGLKQDTCKKNIQRIPVEIDTFSAKEVVYGEYLYYTLKAILNKNLIQRI